MTGEICSDNRFELIEKYKKDLFEHTNIQTSKGELDVLDSILFRCWQMGWLDKLEEYDRQKAEIEKLQEELKITRAAVHNNGLEWGLISIKKLVDDTKTEAIKEVAERLCKDRVSNDPVVIAVKAELKEMTEVDKWTYIQ